MAVPHLEPESSSTLPSGSGSGHATSGSYNTTLHAIRWANENQVNELVHASDNFNVLIGATLALFAAAVAAAITLGAGAVHPVVVYMILSASGFGALITGGLSTREYKNVRNLRSEIKADIAEYYIPLTLTAGTNAFPNVAPNATEMFPASNPVDTDPNH